ncbi:MAG: 2-oxoacid:acceptor oxidoreductase family protein [Desulfomicrobiaceae bacterium]|nr:2-oxoacid:acceptor oxidoreductase family protein [Desulfomicrobiaceae bacterium]
MTFSDLCDAPSGTPVVLQGNIAFALGCVRAGIHAADGYPGTPSTEVIDRGLSQVQDRMIVGWSVNEAVAVAVGFGHTLAGNDCVVTMKIPGLFQAADVITSSAFYCAPRGALIYYIASDYTPSSTQHLLDPKALLRSCGIPILEPRTHQELHESAGLAADISRRFHTPVAILASGTLCHCEGLVRLMPTATRPKTELSEGFAPFVTLPAKARVAYDRILAERLPALEAAAEEILPPVRLAGDRPVGVITHGVNLLHVQEACQHLGIQPHVLALGLTNPLPWKSIETFVAQVKGPIHVLEDGQRYLEELLQSRGIAVSGKTPTDPTTEWSPATVAARLGVDLPRAGVSIAPVPRPPLICPGCPYRLFGLIVGKMRRKGKLDAVFGDIGCNTLLHFLGAMDTVLAMGASEGKRTGYVLAKPEAAGRCLSVLGDSTECHSGMDATRNALFRHVPGVKVILDNSWTAMTGGQPAPTSPVNLAGQSNVFDLEASLRGHGATVHTVDAYDKKGIEKALQDALQGAADGGFHVLVVRGMCIRKVPKNRMQTRVTVDAKTCVRCGLCQICPGLTADAEGLPQVTPQCSGCAGNVPACAQMCPTGALSAHTPEACGRTGCVEIPEAPAARELSPYTPLPERLSVAVRGVGGQGNLFFGRVLTQLAFLLGYEGANIVKGETHGMAQMGGPVISTFACGTTWSPAPLPGTVHCLVAMEQAEVLRPGFVDLLTPDGTILIAPTTILPGGMQPEDYPSRERIETALSAFTVRWVDVQAEALRLGDVSGRSANVVMLGVLSTLAPWNSFPVDYWLEALRRVAPKPEVWQMNHAAFQAGRCL